MKSSFRSLIRFGCNEGTIGGLKYFYIYQDKLSRCFWLVTMVVSCALAGLLSVQLWGRFRAMPTRISIDQQNAPIQELPYPAITLCSPNQITRSNVAHFKRTLVDGNLSINLEAYLPQLLSFYDDVEGVDESSLQHLQSLIDHNRHNLLDVMTSLSQTCSQFLKRCIFERNITPCSELFRPLLTSSGLCCVFNSPYHMRNMKITRDKNFHPRYPTKWGMFGGLSVLTDHMPEDALNSTLQEGGAITIMYNDWSEFPSNDESLVVPPGTEALLPVQAALTYASEGVMQLAVDSRMCVVDEERQLHYFQGYHNADCDTECFVGVVLRVCGCVPLFVPRHHAQPSCTLPALPCYIAVKNGMNDKNLSGEQCDCPRECFSRHYKIESNVGNLGAYRHLINYWQYAGVQFTNSSNFLHMSFISPFYRRSKQETVMSFINLISNLGGVFGLCLGCSVLSAQEVLFYVQAATRRAMRVFIEPRRQIVS